MLTYSRGGGRNAALIRPFAKILDQAIIGPTKILKYKTLTGNGKIFGPTPTMVGVVGSLPPALLIKHFTFPLTHMGFYMGFHIFVRGVSIN